MTLCASSCHVAVPTSSSTCIKKTKKGGIKFLGVVSCAWGFDTDVIINGVSTPVGPITDVDNWILGIENGFIGLSPEGYGEKPASDKTTEQLTACEPDEVTGEDHTINFVSKLMDDDFTQCTFWSAIKSNRGSYRLIYIDCNDLVYVKSLTGNPGWKFSLSGNADLIHPAGNNERMSFEFSPVFRHDPEDGIICPLEVPDFEEIYSAEVNS